MSARDEIRRKVDHFRTELRESFRHPEKRIALFQLLRCLDHKTFLRYIYQRAGKDFPNPRQAFADGRLVSWGWNEALSLFWGEHVVLPGIPLFQTVPEMKNWGDSVLQCSGRVRLIELALELDRLGLGVITPTDSEEDAYNLYLRENATAVESVEKADADYLSILIDRVRERDRFWEKLEDRRSSVVERMESLVRPFENHYIAYDADPDVDKYYHDLSVGLAPGLGGWDAFPLDSSFGGISFLLYIDCVRALMAFAIKHLDFSIILSGKLPAIKPINTVCVPTKWLEACRYMSYALETSESEAEQLMLTTSITPENANYHLSTPNGPLASHYLIGGGHAVRLISGCLDNPFHFMLRELRRRFPRDWDKAVNGREVVFRDELVALLTRFGGVVCFSGNVNISTELGKTDIDAFAFDSVANIAGLFQLKWQDHFAGSMRERESRKSNFLKTGNSWVEKVSKWVESGKMAETLMSLGMPREVATEIKETRLFVIGRNFSHFSGDFQPDCRAAWGNWLQLVRLVDSPAQGASPLTVLFDSIKKDSPFTRSRRSATVEEIRIDGLKLSIHASPAHGC